MRMFASFQSSCRNHLLATLSPEDFSLLQTQLEPIPLPVRTRLDVPNTPIEHAYFLEQGIASVVATTPRGRSIEVAIIGREGMTGTPLLLGTDSTSHEWFIQAPGEALRIRADDLRRAVAQSASLRNHLLRFVQAFTTQVAQTALSNGRDLIEERLARWLLMCHDRLDGNEVPTTHEFLSMMLGVRRQSVTETLQKLEDASLIQVARGRVIVLDRPGLEAAAGESYGIPEAEYARLVGRALNAGKSASRGRSGLLEQALYLHG